MDCVKKRRTILDYFNQNKSINETVVESNIENKIPNNNENNTINDGMIAGECDDSTTDNDLDFIDVNHVNSDIMHVDFFVEDEQNNNLNDYLSNVINIDKKDDAYEANFIFVYEKFRSIIKNIVSDPHYAYLFDEADWLQIQEFTSFKGL